MSHINVLQNDNLQGQISFLTRAVESKSKKGRKSLKAGRGRKVGFDMQLDFG